MDELLKKASEFLAHHKGLPVLIGVGMVLLNLILTLLPAWPVIGWLADKNLFLQLGVMVGLFGIVLGDAL
ncbi:MAG TPA: hypothetical protein PLH19_14790 [Anaerolineae bacterium]|nr:hypothetical protein [Anaerolineae bacterium]HQH39784.1 hypothetical protein [Anaerolineae bacterium]